MSIGALPRAGREIFVGRTGPRANLASALARGAALITVTGVAGVGKSALLRATVGAPGREAQVRWCDLSSATTADEVAGAVSTALGMSLSPRGEEPAMAHVTRVLAALGPAVLVLDDADGAVEVLAAAAEVWATSAPELTVVVGSRQRLALAHEQVLELAPLALPDLDAPSDRCESMEMWRAVARRAGHIVCADDARTVARIVHAVDGLPLGIELAGAQCDLLTPAQVLARLDAERTHLESPLRARRGRHRSLDHALSTSWRALSERERGVLARCSVFRGGFGLDDAEAVVRTASRATALVDVLRALRDRSLLHVRPGTHGPRFDMYRPVRDFASARLEQLGSVRQVHTRHAAWFARATSRDARGAAPLRTASDDRENVRAAVERCAAGEVQPPSAARGLAVALLTRDGLGVLPVGHLPWVRSQVDAALARRGPLDHGSKARALLLRGLLATRLEGPAPALRHFEAAGRTARRGHDRAAEVRALGLAAQAQVAVGERSAGQRSGQRALDLARAEGDDWVQANTLLALGWIERRGAPSFRLDALLAEAAERFGRAGDPEGELRTQIERASAQLEGGRLHEAAATIAAARRLLDPHTHTHGSMLELMGALVHHGGSAFDAALPAYRAAIAAARRFGDDQGEALVRGYLGILELELGRLEDAAAGLRAAAAAVARLGDPVHAALFQVALAMVDAAAGRTDRAARTMRRIAVPGDPAFAPLCALGARAVDIGRFRQQSSAQQSAQSAGGAPAKRRHVLEQRLDDAIRPAPTTGPWSFEVALLARHLRTEIMRGPRTPHQVGPTPHLVVGDACQWLRPVASEPVDIAGRPVMRRLLAALLRAHQTRPGQPLTVVALQESGWPGERMLARSGRTRVKVMLARMREVGLRSVLRSDSTGYWLDPEARIEQEGRAQEAGAA